MSERDERSGRLDRRQALRLLGVGAGVSAGVAGLRWPDGSFWEASAQRAPPIAPRGAILRTVLSDLDPATLTGPTLMHEHLGTGRPGRGGAATDPTQDAAWMTEELQGARAAGLACIVSAQTNLPNAATLEYYAQLSRATGVHIIPAGAPYFTQTYPADYATKSEDEIADSLVTTARAVRLGAFGELGVNNDTADLDASEKKVFRAIGKAQARTGIPVFTHTNYSTGPKVSMDMGLRQLDLLIAAGASPQSIAIGHLCCLDDPMVKIHTQIAKGGAFIAFDRVTRQQQWVSDEHRIVMLKALLDAGLVDQLLISSDYIGRINTSVGEVNMYEGPLHARDKGPGYARPLVLFVPRLRKAGISEQVIQKLTVDNPRRFLAFVPKQG